MELMLGDLLEELDGYYPAGYPIKELEKRFNPRLLHEARADGAIRERIVLGKSEGMVLTVQGYTILNQIRLKKATDSLNNSIKEFDKSSQRYSRKVIGLTIAMGILALVQLIILLIPLFTQA